ncbi:MAG: MGMT family protein, partial [Gluconacetobacter sp.]
RSIGQANGANPIPILIPWHRVVATQGVGGYSGDGGVTDKIYLLELEGAQIPGVARQDA